MASSIQPAAVAAVPRIGRLTPMCDLGDVSVLSWNVLAECYFAREKDANLKYVKDVDSREW
jgi:hypothetical protein